MQTTGAREGRLDVLVVDDDPSIAEGAPRRRARPRQVGSLSGTDLLEVQRAVLAIEGAAPGHRSWHGKWETLAGRLCVQLVFGFRALLEWRYLEVLEDGKGEKRWGMRRAGKQRANWRGG
jgi:hypothetical protein